MIYINNCAILARYYRSPALNLMGPRVRELSTYQSILVKDVYYDENA